jgi:hypothetical protein
MRQNCVQLRWTDLVIQLPFLSDPSVNKHGAALYSKHLVALRRGALQDTKLMTLPGKSEHVF